MLENVLAYAYWTPQHILGLVLTIIISATLFHASLEDIRRRDISSIHVIVLYILACFYIVITGNLGLQTTYLFLFAFLLFMGVSVFSMGSFGIGDSMVIGALALYFHDFTSFQTFLYAMGIISIPWGLYWIIRYRQDNSLSGLIHGFKKTIPITEAKQGMVLFSDRFMHGLSEKDIQKLRQDGCVTITVKNPFPFIPCIFFAFLLTLIL